MISRLPGPLSKTTSVEKCGEAFVKGIEGRKRRINCPRWVEVLTVAEAAACPRRWASRDIRKYVPELLPKMDAEVADARPFDERPHRGAGKALIRRIGVILAIVALLAAVQHQGLGGDNDVIAAAESGCRYA